MHGYCSDCDEQIELVEGNIKKVKNNKTVYIYLVCPYCDEEEQITDVWLD